MHRGPVICSYCKATTTFTGGKAPCRRGLNWVIVMDHGASTPVVEQKHIPPGPRSSGCRLQSRETLLTSTLESPSLVQSPPGSPLPQAWSWGPASPGPCVHLLLGWPSSLCRSQCQCHLTLSI